MKIDETALLTRNITALFADAFGIEILLVRLAFRAIKLLKSYLLSGVSLITRAGRQTS